MRVAGREEDISIIGSDQYYPAVRNLALLAGRFVDEGDVTGRHRVGMLTERLAQRLFGGQQQAVGQTIKIHGLQFTVVGTFKEKTESFGLSEISGENVMIPITVLRYFARIERIDPLYVQAKSADGVESLTRNVRTLLESRHRAGRALSGRQSGRDSGRGPKHRQGADAGANSDLNHRSDYFRHRHHEHHAGDGDRAYEGDRIAEWR